MKSFLFKKPSILTQFFSVLEGWCQENEKERRYSLLSFTLNLQLTILEPACFKTCLLALWQAKGSLYTALASIDILY